MNHTTYKILAILLMLTAHNGYGQTKDPRFSLTQPIEVEIANYINLNIDKYQLSEEEMQNIKEDIEHSELNNIDLQDYIFQIKKSRLRTKYFSKFPDYAKMYHSINYSNELRQSQTNCTNGDFETNPTQYTFLSTINWNHPGSTNVNFGANIVASGIGNFNQINISPQLNNQGANATLVTPGQDPTIQSAGGVLPRVLNGTRAIRLNPRNDTQEDATILTRQFIVDEEILSLNFAVAFNNPNHNANNNPFVRFEVYDLTTNNLIDSRVIASDNSGACLINTPNNPPNSPANTQWRYSPWSCLDLDVSQSIGNNVEFRAIISDCSFAQHDAILYLDDICNNGNVCNNSLFGSLFLNPFNVVCPTESFQICGTFMNPTCINATPVFSLDIIDNNNTIINTLTNGIINNNDGTFCFTIDPIDFGTNPNQNFEIQVNALYDNGTNQITTSDLSTNIGPDVSFVNCPSPCDEVTGGTINGNLLCWLDITDGNYEIQFMTQENCPNGATSILPLVSVVYSQQANCIDLGIVQSALQGKCFRWRIRTDCSDWSDWCLIATAQSTVGTPFVSFNDCIPTNTCENYDLIVLTAPADNINAPDTVNHIDYSTIDASNIIETGATSLYQANETITLLPGFHAEDDSNFTAKIIPCIPAIEPPSSPRLAHTPKDKLKVYPNPATHELNLSLDYTTINTIQLFNIYGNMILSKDKLKANKHILNVDGLSRGYYIIKVNLDDGSSQFKTIILN